MDLTSTLNLALPELILSIGVLVALVFGAVRGDKGAVSVSALSGLCLIGAAYAAAFGQSGHSFFGAFVVDRVALLTKVAIAITGCVVLVLGQGYFTRLKAMKFEFSILILLSILGMFVMVSAADLISLYIGIELQSLALYVLAAIRRDDAKGSEAGLKYFVLGALSSGLLLYGISLIYGFSGSMALKDVAAMAGHPGNVGLIFGLVFVICGLAFKVSAAPFHMWTPDVYEGAPTPVVAFFAGAPKFAAMITFARVLMGGIWCRSGAMAQCHLDHRGPILPHRWPWRSDAEGYQASAGLFLDRQYGLCTSGFGYGDAWGSSGSDPVLCALYD